MSQYPPESPGVSAILDRDALSEAFDAIVVGSGPGGATTARELAARGWRVLLLEMGEQRPVTGGMAQTLRELWMPGRSLFLTTGMLAVLRGVTVGGSSIYAWGTAWQPRYELFQRNGIDLRSEVEEVQRSLSVATLPPDLMGSAARRIMEAATRLGHEWRPLPKFLDQSRLGGPPLGSYGAPTYEAKWNARMYVDDAVSAGAILLTKARANRVLIEDGVATGVEFSQQGLAHTARASTVVVAAGGIGSPALLRTSGIADAGRSFFCDPLVAVTGLLPGPAHGPELPMSGGVLSEQDGYMLTDMSVPPWLYTLTTALSGRIDRLPSYARAASVMVKVRDDTQGSITSRGGIRKRLTGDDRKKLALGSGHARRVLEEAGAEQVSRSLPFAAHPGGGVPVGRLLDSDLRTEVRGLYVCDASVIPDPWGMPPTVTLIALGRRLAGHLAGRTASPRQAMAADDRIAAES